uniref:Uncharacterized protein n=1 Tax=Candidatus Methanogaster sp. ANME-2c ERB4 TaxID=2759911 RepID=A0A7G9YJ32_9EURY|nr:hypothetical protein DCDENBEB_00007 [Methanosarcinales archaeon ANME-2c ERB4]
MIKIEFTEEEVKALRYERYHHPHPRVQRRMEALLLKSREMKHEEICHLTGISPNTLVEYLRKWTCCDIKFYEMLPSKASITPRILLLFTDIRSPGFSKLFRNKSNIKSAALKD